MCRLGVRELSWEAQALGCTQRATAGLRGGRGHLWQRQWPLGAGLCFFLLGSPGPDDRYLVGAAPQTGIRLAWLKLQQPEGQPGGGVSLFLSQPPPLIYCPAPPSSGAWAGRRNTCSQPWPDGADSPHVTGRHRSGGDCGCMGPGTVWKVEGPLSQSQLAFLFVLSGKGQGSRTIAPQCPIRLVPRPPDLSASVNGEATSQKGGSMEDKEQEEGQNSEEGPVGGSSEDLLHNE